MVQLRRFQLLIINLEFKVDGNDFSAVAMQAENPVESNEKQIMYPILKMLKKKQNIRKGENSIG
jgi:hypothetical protein